MDDHPETGAAQLQHAGFDTVVGGEAADQYGVDLAGLQEFDESGAAPFGQVVEAGAVGMQIRLDPLPDEEVIVDGGRQAVEQFEALAARHAVHRPGEVGVGQIQRQQHASGVTDGPVGIGRVSVLAADPQRGEGGLSVERGHNIITAHDGQFVRAERGKALLRINIQAGDGSHDWLLHILFV